MEKIILVKGKLNILRFGKTDTNDVEKFRMNISVSNKDEIIGDITKCYEKAVMKPKFLDGSENLNLSSKYSFPCKVVEEEDIEEIEQLITDGRTVDAEVIVKVVLKEGAMYPKALKVTKLGSKYDVFGDM